MEIKQISLNNFRQYYGQQKIEFAIGDKNITIVEGQNAAGKTGLYRALMFALYGDRTLEQDGTNIGSSDIQLINERALREEKRVLTEVSVEIIDGEDIYQIVRSIQGARVGDRVLVDKENFTINKTDSKGETILHIGSSNAEKMAIVNELLHRNIRGFFLFDGEKIATLAKANKSSKDEIKSGIRKIMDLDLYEESLRILRRVIRNEENAIRARSVNTQLESVSKKIDENQTEIENMTKNKNEREEQLKISQENLISITNNIDKHGDIQDLLEDREQIRRDIRNSRDKLRIYKNNLLSYHWEKLPFIIANNKLNDFKIDLESLMKEQLDQIPEDLLRANLESEDCRLCGAHMEEKEKTFTKELLENFVFNGSINSMRSLNENLARHINENPQNIKKLDEELANFVDERRNLRELLNTSKEIEDLIDERGVTDEEFVDLREREGQLRDEINEHKYRIEKYSKDLEALEIETEKLLEERNEHLSEEKQLTERIKAVNYLENLFHKMTSSHREYEEKIMEELGQRTRENYIRMISDMDKTLVDKVLIRDDYSMDAIDKNGIEITANLSQGQQTILALSFVTALASVASMSKGEIGYPLFMDTPFGRLSSENRMGLINNLPQMTKQWIPLLTDTELTDVERRLFMETGKVGKIYNLNKISNVETIIEELVI